MSLENVIVVDTSALNTLLEAQGRSGLDALLSSNLRIVLTRNVIQETLQHPDVDLKNTFDNWRNDPTVASQLIIPQDIYFDPVVQPGQPHVDPNQLGDLSIYEFLNQDNSPYAGRVLADDTDFLNNAANGNPDFDQNILAQSGQYDRPYKGTGEFLTERLDAGALSQSQYNSVVSEISASDRWQNNISEDFRGEFKSPFEVDQRLRLGAAVDRLTGGVASVFVLAATAYVTNVLITQHAEAKGVAEGREVSWTEAASDLGLEIDQAFLTGIAGDVAQDLAISTVLGPVVWAKRAYELMQSGEDATTLVRLMRAAYPDSAVVQALDGLVDRIETSGGGDFFSASNAQARADFLAQHGQGFETVSQAAIDFEQRRLAAFSFAANGDIVSALGEFDLPDFGQETGQSGEADYEQLGGFNVFVQSVMQTLATFTQGQNSGSGPGSVGDSILNSISGGDAAHNSAHSLDSSAGNSSVGVVEVGWPQEEASGSSGLRGGIWGNPNDPTAPSGYISYDSNGNKIYIRTNGPQPGPVTNPGPTSQIDPPPFGLGGPTSSGGVRIASDNFVYTSDANGNVIYGTLDENGNFIALTTGVTVGDGNGAVTALATTRHDNQGQVVDVVRSIQLRDETIAGGAIGSVLGSSLGNAIGGDNVFARIGASTVLGTVLQNAGEVFGGIASGASPDEAFDAATSNIGNDFGNQLRAAGVGAVSSFLTAELADEIGLDGRPRVAQKWEPVLGSTTRANNGFGDQLFNYAAQRSSKMRYVGMTRNFGGPEEMIKDLRVDDLKTHVFAQEDIRTVAHVKTNGRVGLEPN